jgi:hypothetical protein
MAPRSAISLDDLPPAAREKFLRENPELRPEPTRREVGPKVVDLPKGPARKRRVARAADRAAGRVGSAITSGASEVAGRVPTGAELALIFAGTTLTTVLLVMLITGRGPDTVKVAADGVSGFVKRFADPADPIF